MRKSNFALRLQPSLLDGARKLAEAEGVALNQFISVAVAGQGLSQGDRIGFYPAGCCVYADGGTRLNLQS